MTKFKIIETRQKVQEAIPKSVKMALHPLKTLANADSHVDAMPGKYGGIGIGKALNTLANIGDIIGKFTGANFGVLNHLSSQFDNIKKIMSGEKSRDSLDKNTKNQLKQIADLDRTKFSQSTAWLGTGVSNLKILKILKPSTSIVTSPADTDKISPPDPQTYKDLKSIVHYFVKNHLV